MNVNSYDFAVSTQPADIAYREENVRQGLYYGEMVYQLSYKGQADEPFGWLYIDPVMLQRQAMDDGWTCEILAREADGNYLARLVPA